MAEVALTSVGNPQWIGSLLYFFEKKIVLSTWQSILTVLLVRILVQNHHKLKPGKIHVAISPRTQI